MHKLGYTDVHVHCRHCPWNADLYSHIISFHVIIYIYIYIYIHVCLPTEHFVPARVLRAIQIRWGLINGVSNANAAVWVHPGKSIVLNEFSLIHV